MARVRHTPAFPSTCQIFRGGPPGTGVQVYTGPAEKRISTQLVPLGILAPPLILYTNWTAIYFPAGTDVRGQAQLGGRDWVQWQNNPQWLYLVTTVDDVADGFANKFRLAWCLTYSLPTPLP